MVGFGLGGRRARAARELDDARERRFGFAGRCKVACSYAVGDDDVLDAAVRREPKVIAYRLSINEETVKTHVSTILRKMNAASRTEAVVQGNAKLTHQLIRLQLRWCRRNLGPPVGGATRTRQRAPRLPPRLRPTGS
ncbi:MAG TPA: LuxR C-terminal-related transcriptional regulator, partial [Gemmatimonadaceae bacterium]|nr:LuxR C-terminal-related transcriptional regulator [Gemmatimonadaceae bacterium]